MHVPITEKEAMKVSLKKPMSGLLAGAIACALPLVAGATDTQYSSNFQPIVERVRCWIVSKPIEGNCQLVDRRRSSLVGGANLTVMSYRRNEAGAEGAATHADVDHPAVSGAHLLDALTNIAV